MSATPQNLTRKSIGFVFLYGVTLAFLAALRPLWLDELLQLSSTYRHSLLETWQMTALNPGGVPLGYLGEYVFVNNLGHPIVTAHFFSILCAMAGLAGLIWLTQLIGLAARWFWVALAFAVLPLSLRYAVEARPYGPGLAACILSTALLIRLERQPDWWRTLPYGFAVTVGIYLQPYTAFVAVAHLLWVWLRRPAAKYVWTACLCAALAFLPWYLYARALWVESARGRGFHSLNWRVLAVVGRELSGGGLLLTLALLALACLGYQRGKIPHSVRTLLLLWAVIPLPLVIAGNALFHYFFAIRQVVFVIPAICILAVEGLYSLPGWCRPAIAFGLMLSASVHDVRWFSDSAEDWSLSAAEAQKAVRPGTCVSAIPRSTQELFKLYRPSLPFCAEDEADGRRSSVVLVAPFATPEQQRQLPANAGAPAKLGGILVYRPEQPPSGFALMPVSPRAQGPWVKIVNKVSGRVLDLPTQCAQTPGCQIQQWDWNRGPQQEWRLIPVPSGDGKWFKLLNRMSGKVLDMAIQCQDTAHGCDVQQWPANGGLQQQWQFIAQAPDYFAIASRLRAVVLDGTGGETASGATVHARQNSVGAQQQLWAIVAAQSNGTPVNTQGAENSTGQ